MATALRTVILRGGCSGRWRRVRLVASSPLASLALAARAELATARSVVVLRAQQEAYRTGAAHIYQNMFLLGTADVPSIFKHVHVSTQL